MRKTKESMPKAVHPWLAPAAMGALFAVVGILLLIWDKTATNFLAWCGALICALFGLIILLRYLPGDPHAAVGLELPIAAFIITVGIILAAHTAEVGRWSLYILPSAVLFSGLSKLQRLLDGFRSGRTCRWPLVLTIGLLALLGGAFLLWDPFDLRSGSYFYRITGVALVLCGISDLILPLVLTAAPAPEATEPLPAAEAGVTEAEKPEENGAAEASPSADAR